MACLYYTRASNKIVCTILAGIFLPFPFSVFFHCFLPSLTHPVNKFILTSVPGAAAGLVTLGLPGADILGRPM